jgi:hypothetical protein
LNSKKSEEVRKRRAKANAGRVNIYQKMILVAGILTLFLAIGLSPMMAPILAAGIVGGTLLLFLLVRRLRPKKEEPGRVEPAETLLPAEPAAPCQQESIRAKEETSSPDSAEMPAEEQEMPEAGEVSLGEQEQKTRQQTFQAREIVLPGKEPSQAQPAPPHAGALADFQQRLALVEEKTSALEDLVQQLEGKIADFQELQIKAEPKIDLQTILANLDEKHHKMM